MSVRQHATIARCRSSARKLFRWNAPEGELTRVRYHWPPMKRLAIISAVLSAVIMLVATVRPASAHPVPFSYLDLRLQTSSIDGVFVVHIFDAAHDLQVTPVDRLLDPALASEYARALIDLLAARLEV